MRQNDRRKHYTQMTPDEVIAVRNAVAGKSYKLSGHVSERMQEKNIKRNDLVELFKKFSIIECHNNVPKQIRVLIRNEAGCCAVVSLPKREIITAYWNSTNDHHDTLDVSNYKWDVNLTQLFRA